MRGLFLAGLIFGGKFAFQNRLGWLIDGSKLTVFALFYFVFEGNFPNISPGGLIFGGRFNGGFFYVTGLGGLISGGVYFRNFTAF